ncbi:hypothetical protein G7Z17_g13199 [Cylindrodendrum hubeiense]|uniref:Enolase n=1 Tax=Cylindrodendrum hubeiense TaxID=595255 RepID=A0A9P5GSN9_9HYPO|nr:hypothetical protein G7Z17_g13199 [Cylindrodendrum hubeiense]
MAITKVFARSVYDSRGNPTVEVDVVTETGLHRAIVPSGASTGQHEACELRDGDKTKWGGKGVTKAVDNVNTIIAPALIEKNIDVKDQSAVDAFLNELDGTPNKTKLGANAILGVSLAVAKAGAAEKGVPLYAHVSDLAGTKKPYVLPVPFMNVLNGGSHAGGRLAFQEFMIVPTDAPTFSEALRQGSEVYHALKGLAKKRYGQSAGNVGDEGGVAPDIQTAEEALELITDAIEQAGYTGEMKIAMDVASSEFYKEEEKKYDLDFKNPESDPTKWITYEELAALYGELCKKYPIVSIEDPFAEDDWEAWSYFSKAQDIQVVGDDLTVTNPLRIKKAIELKSCNALLLKVNQIGTLTESIQAAKDSYADGWGVMVSHRSGETEDVTIADIAVGLRAGEIKTGAPARSERLAKLNQILRIEEELAGEAIYPGANFRNSVNLLWGWGPDPAASEDLIDFDLIEGQKENIQSLPGGRSAKKLAELYSPSPLHKLSTPTPSDTRNVNDCIRAEYEAEVDNIAESDDPLDVFDRYVRWTLDAYPSAQATPQSQLHTLLERATKAFIGAPQYKNDPRYLKLWVYYIHFFSDAPRETYMFLSRQSIGEGLALYYEEYAAWLEGASRWAQAEEVYKLGIEREARPVQRLLRKFKEFEERVAQQPEVMDEPSSPALPSVRPALAAKVDPFSAASRPTDPQAPRPASGGGSKPAKSKLAIFSDTDSKPSAMASRGPTSKGWDTIGSLADRKKENVVEAKPWVGETLKAGGKKSAAPKMAIFRDLTGKKERVFVDLAAIYPTPEEQGTELSFEEIMAGNRGWLDCAWEDESIDENLVPEPVLVPLRDIEEISKGVSQKLVIHQDPVHYDENGAVMEQPRAPRGGKKKKVMEVNETQIIKAKLDSPSRPKLRKKNTSEPTMTLHTKSATDDIYDIFNAPLKPSGGLEEEESGDDDDYESDDNYTTDAESTCTTRQVDASEVGDDEVGDDETSDVKSVSEWSDFSTRRHVPDIDGDAAEGDPNHSQVTDLIDTTVPEPEHSSSIGEVTGSQGEDEDAEDEEAGTPVSEDFSPVTLTSFIPIPPEDYDPPTRPYRDPTEAANNRLPFMTPITERTEVSLDVYREEHSKTPCKRDESSILDDEEDEDEGSELEPMSSPLREIVNDARPAPKISAPLAPKSVGPLGKSIPSMALPSKGPIIKDVQCNPVDEAVRSEIITNMQPPLSSYAGFYDHRQDKFERGGEIRKFAKALTKASKAGADRTGPLTAPVVIEFPNTQSIYTVKKELGAGAFAPVYLVENSAPEDKNDENAVVAMGKGAFAVNHRSEIEALKMETPPTPWEFHMMRVAHARLGPQHRASASLSVAHEMHLYQDEAFLFLPYHPHGTLLDVINWFRAEPSAVMDEQLAIFFTIELMRTVEALHSKGVLHGDLKADNCLLRLDALSGDSLASQWHTDGSGGWSSRGVVLIDFGRGIDMRAFVPDVEFIADWKTSAQDCAEMREGRPWTWQIDYHGLAGTIHCLLFGKYIETVRCDQGGIGKTGRKYRIRESLKRYWQTDLWTDCFELLLNPGSFVAAEDGSSLPVLRSMRAVRERMEVWLEANCERGVGLKSLVSKLEAFARSRK